ncbi:MAG: CRISPR system Cmr subunit Cmr5 [Euryarchaeota archaeon ADurb.Bin190]|jgi:CRISPR-associated protein Cmr5|nr:MAG: CRISPR system Cmr subunit Cmr5 [Euryarchaeota archaeon ADurb.Bin190]
MAENSLEQRRAARALKSAKEIRNKSYASKFRSYVERLPASIVMNGLGQALASEFAAGRGDKGEIDSEAHEKLFNEIEDWLLKERKIYSEKTDLMSSIVSGSQEQYILAQAEALAYLEWLKKFSQAFLKKEV